MDDLNLVELARRLENIIRTGTIAEADYPSARVRVKYDEDENGDPVLTEWLPWYAGRAGNNSDWCPPEVGEQVTVLSQSGNMALGVVLPAVYQTAHPAPSNDPDIRNAVFADGTFVEYNRATNKLTVDVQGDVVVNTTGDLVATVAGAATVEATGDANVKGANVVLNDGGSGGVVCQHHPCSFTGGPHPQGSSTVKAGG